MIISTVDTGVLSGLQHRSLTSSTIGEDRKIPAGNNLEVKLKVGTNNTIIVDTGTSIISGIICESVQQEEFVFSNPSTAGTYWVVQRIDFQGVGYDPQNPTGTTEVLRNTTTLNQDNLVLNPLGKRDFIIGTFSLSATGIVTNVVNVLPQSSASGVLLGWNSLQFNMTVASINATYKNAVINTGTDIRAITQLGDKIKLVQTDGTKYGLVVAITATQMTVWFGRDYAPSTNPITEVFFSIAKSPQGWNADPMAWSVVTTLATTFTSPTNPTNGAYLNVPGLTTNLSIGAWTPSFRGSLGVASNTGLGLYGARTYLSTSSTTYAFPTVGGVSQFIGGHIRLYGGGTIQTMNVPFDSNAGATFNQATNGAIYVIIGADGTAGAYSVSLEIAKMTNQVVFTSAYV